MARRSAARAADRLAVLSRLSAALGRTMSLDDVARATLAACAEVDGTVRAGLAVAEGAGRELRFVASDGDAISGVGVRWCRIDGLADVPLAQAARSGAPVHLSS